MSGLQIKNKQLAYGALLSYCSIGLNIICGLLYTPWMVQKIGQSQYGLYTLANSLITLFLVDFGLSMATSRYISKYRAEGDQEKIDQFLSAVYKIYLLITAVIFLVLLVLYFLLDTIYVELSAEEIRQFKVVYVISATFAVVNFPCVTFNGILTSYEKFAHLKLADVLYRLGLVGSTVAALLLGGGLYALVALHAVVGLLAVLYKFIVIKRSIAIKVDFRKSSNSFLKEIFSFSIWVTLSSLAQRLIFNLAPSVLAAVSGATEIAVFGVVATLESYIYTVITALNGMFMPKIARIIVEDEKQLAPLMLKVGRFLYALNGLIIAEFVVVGQTFISLWMGPEYGGSYWGLLLVLVPGMFYNSLQIANTTMIAAKKVNIQAMVTVITGVTNVILSFPLASQYGAIGACAAIFLAYILRAVILNTIYFKMPQFGMGTFVKKCYLQMSLPIVATVLIGSRLMVLVETAGWTGLIVVGGITAAVYATCVCLLGVSAGERRAALGTIGAICKRK